MGVNLAWSRTLDGPWSLRYGLIPPFSTNPAAALLPNGTVLLAYKTWPSAAECTRLVGRSACKAVGLYSTGARGWNASYSHRPMGDRWVAVAEDIEDPSMYRDPDSGALHMLLHTTDGGGAGGSAHSTNDGARLTSHRLSRICRVETYNGQCPRLVPNNARLVFDNAGVTWSFDPRQHAYEYSVRMADGEQLELTNREEPV